MANPKAEEILSLATKIIDDSELSRGDLEIVVMKATRLARLTEDNEALRWLFYEIHGYIEGEPTSVKYLSLTGRRTGADSKNTYYGPISSLESGLEVFESKLEMLKAFRPTGDWAFSNFQSMQQEASVIHVEILKIKRIISQIRSLVHRYATRIYYERIFSDQAEEIFKAYQLSVDVLLSRSAGVAFDKLPAAFERLASSDLESVSHALTTCRRVIDAFASSVTDKSKAAYKIGEEEVDISDRYPRNQIRYFIHRRLGSGRRYERLNKMLNSMYDRISTGVHSEVDISEAKALVLQTYLFLGEILQLPEPSYKEN